MPEGFDDPVNIEGVEFEDVVAALLQVDPSEDSIEDAPGDPNDT